MTICYAIAMTTDAWRLRLYDKIRQDGRSLTEISQAAGLGVNYAEQLMKHDKDIRVPVLIKLCDVLGVSTAYVLTGLDLDADGERLVKLASTMAPEKVRSLIALLQG